MKIVFMGTPDFAEKSLKILYENNQQIELIVTKVDKPTGRGMKMIFSPVKQFAEKNKIRYIQPEKIKNNEEVINLIKDIQPDILCVVAYGKILPKELLEIPKYGAINLHGSILPKYRGAAPIQWSVINGEKVTGITTMFMDQGMDTGDIILTKEVEIGENETTGELWEKLSIKGAELLLETIEKIEKFSKDCKNLEDMKIKLNVQKQDDEQMTLAPMLNKEISKIDWNKSVNEIHNLVRGLNPFMGAITFYQQNKFKIWKTEKIKIEDFENKFGSIEFDKNIENGTIIKSDKKDGVYIKTNDGIISILELQAENSKKLSIKDFLNGREILENVVLK